MKSNKYNYTKVIQQHYGQGWEDASEYETDSQGNQKDFKDNSNLKHDLREYKLMGYPTRVIQRKELKNQEPNPFITLENEQRAYDDTLSERMYLQNR